MNKLKYIGIIPARYDSTRFPGKPLAMIGGKMMIQRVWERVSSVLEHVIVATDDERIIKAVESFGGEAVMTSKEHRSGTDRCNEAYIKAGNGEDVIINIQGDEPLIEPSCIKQIITATILVFIFFIEIILSIEFLTKYFITTPNLLIIPSTPRTYLLKNHLTSFHLLILLMFLQK